MSTPEEDEYEDDLEAEETTLPANEQPSRRSLSATNLMSSTPVGSKPPIPIGGRRKDEDEDRASVESYDGSFDSAESQSAAEEAASDRDCSDLPRSSTDLQQRLYDATKRLAAEGEKGVALALELEKYKDSLRLLTQEAEAFRTALLRGMNVADANNYSHVSLDELLRLRVQESASLKVSPSHGYELTRNESSVSVIQALEQKLGLESQRNEALDAKILSLKGELEEAANHTAGVESLALRVSKMNERLRIEREAKVKVQKELSVEKDKVVALSDHIGKLVVHLKHEAVAKARSQADQLRLHRELETSKMRNAALERKSERKDQVITELRDSGRTLEEQLLLMDEKYMELRTKLDWTRAHTKKLLKRKEDELRRQALQAEATIPESPRPKPPKLVVRPRPPPLLEGRRSVVALHKSMNEAFSSKKSPRDE